MKRIKLIGIISQTYVLAGLIWCLTPTFGGCPTFYNLPCSTPHQNPSHDIRIFPNEEKRDVLYSVWDFLDSTIQRSCELTGLKFPKLVMIWLSHQVEPGYCSIVRICNKTACMELGPLSQLFTEEIHLPEEHLEVVLRHEETLKLKITQTKIVQHQIGNQLKEPCTITSAKQQLWDYPFYDFHLHLVPWRNAAQEYYQNYCQDHRVNDFIFTFDGILDFFCSHLVVCSYKKCLVYSLSALKVAKIFPINSCFSNAFPELPICSAVEINTWPFGRRKRRRPLSSHVSTGLFNLPFTKYCGPGTDIIFEDDNGGPTGEVDAACRRHDIAYMLGDDPAEADEELLQNVWAVGSPFYYAFWLALRTKQAFETVTGKAYTSSLYVTPVGTAATFAHYFYFKSVFDGFDTNSTKLDIIKEKELLWRGVVLDIWRGQCYVQKRPGSDTEQSSGAHVDVKPSGSQTFAPDIRNIESAPVNTDDESSITVESDYPPPTPSMAPCRVVINEVLTDDGLSATSFIELLKVCPDGVQRDRATSLKNFYLAVIQAADPVKLHVFIDIGQHAMVATAEKTATAGGVVSKNNYYFVVGSTNVKEKNMNLKLAYGGRGGIPSGSNNDDTYSVVLLNSAAIKQFSGKYKSALPAQLTDEEVESFGIAMQDIVTYGTTCNRARCSTFMKWNLGLLQLDENDNIIPIPDQADDKVKQSINRCSQTAYPMQQESWESANPSPLRRNECSVKVDPLYVFKRGCSIQSSAQYVIMNVKNFFHSYKQGSTEGLLEGSETELTSKATGVSVHTIKSINARHIAGNIQTPRGRKRKRVSRAICRFKEEDKNHIKKFIQEKFEKNLPPYFDAVYNNAQQYFKDQNPPRVMCGKHTFRKLLYMMGFHYGRIDTLLVVLERPDIVVKRSVFLKKMKANDRSPSPKPVIYTDESWIDPHARSGKAWVPRAGLFDHEEKLKYTYQKHHTNRGRRIIMIHAGGPKGLLHDSAAVFEVGGSKQYGSSKQQSNVEDYHDNIESTFYFEWFRNLCVNINKYYDDENAIIVIDNAPYHTKSDAPKSGARKKELEDYLHKVDIDGKFTGFDKNKKYLRWELWQFVMQYKKENSDHYIIDRLAMEYGHTVIRLPPHQCNFNPIEMLWHQGKEYVRKNNPDQTIESVKNTIQNFFLTFPTTEWLKLVDHTDRLREEYWKTDKIYDEFLDAIEDRLIPEDPGTLNEEGRCSDSTVDNDFGPLDSYMHAGTDIVFDDNGDIILEGDSSIQDS